jgi:dipeptidyl aminopeptidase
VCLPPAGDGVYSYKLEDNSIMLHDLTANTTTRLVEGSKILNDYGIRLEYSTFQVSPDLRYILFGVDRDPVWRWSSRANYWIHDLEHSTTVPLIPITSPPSTAIAKWSPKGHNIAFVQNNDLYISTLASSSSNGTVIRITRTGNETIFNGVPDWVYEEEVFSSDSATWWSPDGKKLAFLSFDESEVHVYSFPVYNPKERHPGGDSYPTSMDMRYPKPGSEFSYFQPSCSRLY